jgi:membrane glycosyltransferase
VNIGALILAMLLAAGGVRSLLHWRGRAPSSSETSQVLLYAAFVTCRIGFWFALAGFVVVLGLADDPFSLRWLVGFPAALALGQIVTAYLLGRSTPADDKETPAGEDAD